MPPNAPTTIPPALPARPASPPYPFYGYVNFGATPGLALAGNYFGINSPSVQVTPTPTPPVAPSARASAGRARTAAVTMMAVVERRRMSVPTGLADGLATWPAASPGSPWDSPRELWFPRSPATLQGIRRGRQCSGSYG